jgi:hypothetical protein
VLLNALDGFAYIVAVDGTILAVGEPGWSDFAITNGAPSLIGDAAIGKNLFDTKADDEVLEVQKDLHCRIVEKQRPAISFEYRCDAPDMIRRMRMALRPIINEQRVEAVLYQSIILEQTPRPRMSLFEKFETGDLVTLCSYCHDVAWPPGAADKDRTWIEPEEYYRRGGPAEVMVNHGMCPECYERVMNDMKV